MKRLLFLWLALPIGCAAPDDDLGQKPEQEVATGSSEALTIGSRGEEVRALNGYLTRYGYFPNAELTARYPGFEPLVAEPPADANVYDEHLADAVRRYQQNMGVEATGVADAATLGLTRHARCAWPDGYRGGDEHQHEKFATFGGSRREFTWSIESWPSSTTEATLISLTQEMIDEWKRVYPSALTRVARGQGQLKIRFQNIDGPTSPAALLPDRTCNPAVPNSGCTLGEAGEGFINLDIQEPWVFTGTNTFPKNDYRTVILHELGHRLGMNHSGRTSAIMYANTVRGESKRVTSADDRLGVRSSYAVWQNIVAPAPATDIGAADRLFWISNESTPGGFKIYGWLGGSTHQALDGGAVRIAVDGRNRPWVVNSAGSIYYRAQDNSGWREVAGCARDIAVVYNGPVAVVGCDGRAYLGNMNPNQSDSGLDPQRNSGFVLVSPAPGVPQPNLMNVGGFGTDAVIFNDSSGVVWVVNFLGVLYKLQITSPIVTSDVGGSLDGESLWAVRSGSGVFAMNIQEARVNTPAKSGWTGYPNNTARRITAATNGIPFYINDVGTIMTTTK